MNLKMNVSELWPLIKNKMQSKRVKIITGSAFVVVIGVIISAVFLLSPKDNLSPDVGKLSEGDLLEGQQIETLPAVERVYDNAKPVDGGNPFQGDVLDYARISGIIINSDGKSTAIIQTPNASYIAEEGKTLGASAWVVSRIESHGVTVISGGKTKLINMEDSSKAVVIE